jgi:hypothetical protein
VQVGRRAAKQLTVLPATCEPVHKINKRAELIIAKVEISLL